MFLFISILTSVVSSSSNLFFVNPITGDDNNNGTSTSSAFRSLTAVSNLLQSSTTLEPNITVRFAPARYDGALNCKVGFVIVNRTVEFVLDPLLNGTVTFQCSSVDVSQSTPFLHGFRLLASNLTIHSFEYSNNSIIYSDSDPKNCQNSTMSLSEYTLIILLF